MTYPYEYINLMSSAVSPNTVHSQNTTLVQYFRRWLLQRAVTPLKFTFPETFDKWYTVYSIYVGGFVTVFDTKAYGLISQHCTLAGRGLSYQPTHVRLSNPLLPDVQELKIGEDCALIRLAPDYGGVMDIVNDYAEQLALISELVGVNVVNSKLSYILGAASKQGAEALKKVYDQIQAGNPAVALDKSLFDDNGKPTWMPWAQDLRQNFIAADGLELYRKCVCMFDNEIGISANLATAKKERTISAEVDANNDETLGRLNLWIETLEDGMKQCREMFGLSEAELNCSPRFTPEEVQTDESDDVNYGSSERRP